MKKYDIAVEFSHSGIEDLMLYSIQAEDSMSACIIAEDKSWEEFSDLMDWKIKTIYEVVESRTREKPFNFMKALKEIA